MQDRCAFRAIYLAVRNLSPGKAAAEVERMHMIRRLVVVLSPSVTFSSGM